MARRVDVSSDIGGTSSKVNSATNIGVGATRPQRFNSHLARRNFTSDRSETSSTIFVVPR